MEKLSILIVDDRPENLVSMTHLLARDDLSVLTAESGNEALGMMLDADLALVLLDVQMPDMNGFEVAELMKRHPRTRHLPIIFVTAISKERGHVFSGYEAGAADYICKPVDPFVIRSKVNVFLELKRSQIARERLVEDLNRANNRLQEISGQKDDTISAASTKLRPPLTAIKESCSLVRDGIAGPVSEQQYEYMAGALRSCDRLIELISDLEDTDGLDSDRHQITQRRTEVRDLLATVGRRIADRDAEPVDEVELEAAADLPAVLCDAGMIKQALLNLVADANASPSRARGVKIVARREQEAVNFEVTGSCDPEPVARCAATVAAPDDLSGPAAVPPANRNPGVAESRKLIGLHGVDLDVNAASHNRFCFRFCLPIYSHESHLTAFVRDSTRFAPETREGWSLVLLRSAADHEDVPQWLNDEIRRNVRGKADRLETVNVVGAPCSAVMLHTDRVGAMSFLSRLEESIRRRRSDCKTIQYLLADVTSERSEKFILADTNPNFRTLVMTLSEEGAARVHE